MKENRKIIEKSIKQKVGWEINKFDKSSSPWPWTNEEKKQKVPLAEMTGVKLLWNQDIYKG